MGITQIRAFRKTQQDWLKFLSVLGFIHMVLSLIVLWVITILLSVFFITDNGVGF